MNSREKILLCIGIAIVVTACLSVIKSTSIPLDGGLSDHEVEWRVTKQLSNHQHDTSFTTQRHTGVSPLHSELIDPSLQNEVTARIGAVTSTTNTLSSDKAAQQETSNSILRFDWTNLPPLTKLGRRMAAVQSKCLDPAAKEQPQSSVAVQMTPSGMGSSLHTWAQALCHATEHNLILITRNGWNWNDAQHCPDFIREQSHRLDEFNVTSSGPAYSQSALWCYFGHHESGLQCPGGTIDRVNVHEGYKSWGDYRCEGILAEYGFVKKNAAAMEWLFQNVSTLVIDEAHRQVKENAFPELAKQESLNKRTPPCESLISIHIRWGDKHREMKLVSLDAYVEAVYSLLTEEEKAGRKPVHIYITTEDPGAVRQFQEAVPESWHIHTSGPTNRTPQSAMMSAASGSKGRAGLESLGALLVAMQANRYILTTDSNWSFLINELRRNIVDPRCGNCTKMVDLRPSPLFKTYGQL